MSGNTPMSKYRAVMQILVEAPRCVHCHGSPSAGWKRVSRHRAFQMGVSSLRINSRGNVGAATQRADFPTELGKPPLHGLVATWQQQAIFIASRQRCFLLEVGIR